MTDADAVADRLDQRLLSDLGPSVYGGASIGEVLAAERTICRLGPASRAGVLAAFADRLYADAGARARRGRGVSAREQFLKASHTYCVAARAVGAGTPRQRELGVRSRQAFTAAMGLAPWAFEPAEVEACGWVLNGYHLAPPPPARCERILVVTGGTEHSLEEAYLHVGAAALERGWQLLLAGGPGTDGDRPAESGSDGWLSGWLDVALQRPGVDPARLAVLGFGSGGHVALRTTAADRRVAAVIADPPLLELGTASADHPPVDPAAIRCPALALIGAGEDAATFDQFERFAHQVSGPIRGHVFTPEEGADRLLQIGNLPYANAVLFDWLDEIVAEPATRTLERSS